MSIGERIKQARKEKGFTQKQCAEKAGIATITIQQYEGNKRQPQILQLQKIASALNMAVDDLLNTGDKIGERRVDVINAHEDEFTRLVQLLSSDNLIGVSAGMNAVLSRLIGGNDEAQNQLVRNFETLCFRYQKMIDIGTSLIACDKDSLAEKYVEFLKSYDMCIGALSGQKEYLIKAAKDFGLNKNQIERLTDGKGGDQNGEHSQG